MKNKIIISFTILLILSFIPSFASADVLEPGEKQVDFYYKVSNINDYSDYIFLIHGTPSPSYEIINSSEFGFYKLSTVSIYAIKKSDFNMGELKNMDNAQCENYFKNDPRVIRSNIQLDGTYGTVGIDNPLEKATVILEIVFLSENKLNIQKSSVIYTYTDGTSQEEHIQNQNILPEPKTSWFYGLWYLLPVLAIIAIGIILISRKYKQI